MQLFVRLDGATHVLDAEPESTLSQLGCCLQERCAVGLDDAYLQASSGLVSLSGPASLAEAGIEPESTLTVCFRLLGGKGGFGALLRGAGRAAATDNFDAYRDLSGRRVRHINADERLREWAQQSKEMQRQLAELKRLKEEEKVSKSAAVAEEHSHAVREAQRAAVAGILATMEEHFSSSGTKRPASSQQQQPQSQPQLKRSKLLDLGDMDFGSDASSDDESDSEFFESMVLDGGQPGAGAGAGAGHGAPAPRRESPDSGISAAEAQAAPPEATAEQPPPQTVPQPLAETAAADAPSAATPAAAAAAGPSAADAPRDQPAAAAAQPEPQLDISSFGSQAELEALGAHRLKAQLQQRGLKCGGTVAERASRLFLLKNTPLDKLDAKFFARKPAKGDK